MNLGVPVAKMGGVQRSSSISLIRLIALVFIISCHIMQWLNFELAWWFNVGVQIFLCISGYLYGQKDVGELTSFYSRRFKKILIPYFIVFISYGLLQFFFAKDVFVASSFLKGLLVNATLKGAGHLWFVATILMCYVLTPLLEVYSNRYVKNRNSWIVFTLLAVEITVVFFGLFDRFFNPVWISCYVIGNAIQIYCSYVIHKDFPGYQYFCDFNHVMLGVFLFLALMILCDKLKLGKGMEGLLHFTDKYSYEMYLVHHLIILGPFSLMALTGVNAVNIVIILVLTVLLAMMLKCISEILQKVIIKPHAERRR